MKKYNGYALVTGGDSGIGYCISEQLAMKGYNLVLVARNKTDLDKAKEQLSSQYKINVLIFIQDLTETTSAKNVYNFVRKKNIHICLLVNNAGFGIWGLFEDSKCDVEVKMIELMCSSLTALTNLFLPDMIKKREGGIILVSSFASRQHLPKFAVYAACKAFVSSFGTTLSFELQSKNIDVLVVCPAVMKTPFYKEGELKENLNRGQKKFLGFKYHSPERVAEQIVKSLGKKIEIVVGDFLDKFFFYSMAFTPLIVQRWVMRIYYKYTYKTTY